MTGLLRAEFRKVRTTRMWWGLLLGGLASTAISVVATVLTAGTRQGGGFSGPTNIPTLSSPAVLRSVYGGGFTGMYVFALILGIIAVSGEYRHQTITATLLATPRRGRLVLAKLISYTGWGLLYGLVGTGFAVALGATLIRIKGFPAGLTADRVPQTLALAVLGVVIWAVFGLGIGTLLRNQIAAILLSLGVTLLVEPIATLLLNHFHYGGVAKYLPGSASNAIIQGVSSGQLALLTWWAGALVLAAYGLVFATLGAALTLRRDVT